MWMWLACQLTSCFLFFPVVYFIYGKTYAIGHATFVLTHYNMQVCAVEYNIPNVVIFEDL